ncbi:hypothetical protein VTO42DRAFT_1519 [Malbranchea cinnamomea]
MNQTQPYLDVHPSHLASTQPYTSQPGPAENVSHYPQYQAPVLHPTSYGHGTSSYPQYGYPNGVSSPTTSQPITNALAPPMQTSGLLPLHPPMTSPAHSAHSYPSVSGSGQQQEKPKPIDITGQLNPLGLKPKVSATLWEDEGTLCYQIEVGGICVARREDNQMINGTKLLNVAKMTRGRRDGILKSEKNRQVVKIGPMHLKGVWIPFERALDFANKEGITDRLWPLFVHNLKAIVVQHHPDVTSTLRPDRKRLEAPPGSRSQPLPALHHHSLSNPQPSLTPQPRPPLDRAHTYPNPPSSASSLMAITHPSSSYEWSGHTLQGPPPLSVDSGLSGARSLPTTPAATPSSNIHHYQSQPTTYDSKPYFPPTPQTSQPHYASQPSMAQQSIPSQANGPISHASSAEPHLQEAPEYVTDANHTAYNSSRDSYAYPSNTATNSLAGEPQLSSDMTTSSVSQPNGTIERAPSRQSTQAHWAAPPTYPTSQQRTGVASSNLYNVVSDTRGSTTNGTLTTDPYATPPSKGSTAYSSMKGSNKRGRDEDDEPPSHTSETVKTEHPYDFKRRKTISESTVNGVVGASVGLQSVTTGAIPRRH